MFIMGHAPQLAARSNMWAQIIEDLSENQAVGEGWPIACARHPDDIRYVKTPGEIQLLSPDRELYDTVVTSAYSHTGGCMQQWSVAFFSNTASLADDILSATIVYLVAISVERRYVGATLMDYQILTLSSVPSR